jgi:hypothetical protein
MKKQATRNFTDLERVLIQRLLTFVGPDDEKLSQQFAVSVASDVNSDGSIVRIIHSASSDSAKGQRVVAEGQILDADGAFISVLLFCDSSDNLYEFELVKYELSPIRYPLKMETFRRLDAENGA